MSHRELNGQDSGKQAVVAVGDDVFVILGENPTTGFLWAPDGLDGTLLTLVSSDFRRQGTGTGAGGERRFHLTAKAAGRTPLRFKLWRAWEGDASVQRRFAVDLEIDARR
jgi:predicted secreted protein